MKKISDFFALTWLIFAGPVTYGYITSLSVENKGIYFKRGLNRGIHSSPSEKNMRNSVIKALLARIRLIKNARNL